MVEKMFLKEIALMMHGFGDSSEPLADTVRLVEAVTLQQIRAIIDDLYQQVERRGSDKIEPKDIVFLMRHNHNALRRLQRFVRNKYMKKNFENLESVNNCDVTKNPNIDKIVQAVEALDETGELTDLDVFDSVRFERQLRADRISASLDEEKYMEYYKARCTSFMNREFSLLKNVECFKLWLYPKEDKIPATKLSTFIVEILAYLAFETVARIVDFALIVRNDINRKVHDLLGGLGASNYCNPASFNTSQVYERFRETGKGQEGQLAITPNEVREALRRFEMSQVGQFMNNSYKRTKIGYLAF
ncbi:transcription initiation protein SPT3 homolog [Chrysoperla carnea]|uniref:transcription initiation protein SPT3 homolog n=1 Tax=Chrysoperla carnea TaxID=189513 RepID=UPI001D075DD5|nr:transcription initiation protein SPT3 homolog [Chrysoperla carnea]